MLREELCALLFKAVFVCRAQLRDMISLKSKTMKVCIIEIFNLSDISIFFVSYTTPATSADPWCEFIELYVASEDRNARCEISKSIVERYFPIEVIQWIYNSWTVMNSKPALQIVLDYTYRTAFPESRRATNSVSTWQTADYQVKGCEPSARNAIKRTCGRINSNYWTI